MVLSLNVNESKAGCVWSWEQSEHVSKPRRELSAAGVTEEPFIRCPDCETHILHHGLAPAASDPTSCHSPPLCFCSGHTTAPVLREVPAREPGILSGLDILLLLL